MSLSDTDPRQQERYEALLRRLTPSERWRKIGALHDGMRVWLAAAIRRQFPTATEDEIKQRIAVRMYGRTVAARMFESLPEDA